jgi:hypothetical protein
MMVRDRFLLWVGDTHTYPGGVGLLPKYALTSPGNEWVFERWQATIERVKRIARTHDVIGCLGGDLVDLPGHAEAVDLAVDALKPFVNLCGELYGVWGTPHHVAESGKEDRSVYGQFGAVMPRESAKGHHWLDVGHGQVINWAHHDIAVNNDPSRDADGSVALARRWKALELYRGYPRSTAIVRHHRHLAPLDDVEVYGKKVRVVPCFKLPDSYGHQKSPGVLPDIGVVAYWPKEHRFETWRYPIDHTITRVGARAQRSGRSRR